MPWSDYMNWVQSLEDRFPYGTENEELLRNIEEENLGWIVLPFVCLHPRIKVPEQLESLRRLAKNYKIYGIKFHTLDTESYIEDFFSNEEITEFCNQYKLPVLIHSANYEGYENCMNIFDIARKHWDINILIAHMMNFSRDFFDRMIEYESQNLFFDISPFLWLCKLAQIEMKNQILADLPFDNPLQTLEALYNAFPTRLVWWSDQPFWRFNLNESESVDYDIDDELKLLFSSRDELIQSIAQKNSKRFLGIA